MSEQIVHVQTVLQVSRAEKLLEKAKQEKGCHNMKDALGRAVDVYLGDDGKP